MESRGSYKRWGKRVLDLVFVVPGLIIAIPVLTVVAVLVYCFLGSPVLFRQIRPGFLGRPFPLWKFRTMRHSSIKGGTPLPDEARITPFGKVLRNLSLDELPELYNVLRGDMSLVGPRPLLPEYLERYSPEQARRHEVKPGLTGWAQINGRNAISWDDKFAMDVWYVEHCSFLLDLKIIAMTVIKVLRGEGISAPGEATMPEFRGTGERKESEENV
jgi:sugar transferase EpsL